jgi:transcriptional regulator with XRE-family HTH domain
MSKTKTKYPNQLTRYRERLGLTQDQLAQIIGCRTAQTIRRIEMGHTIPGVVTVLRLSAALRVPVEFLYQETFIHLREEVRATEEGMPRGRQGMLPLPV